jgi:steroid Delta-isomerase
LSLLDEHVASFNLGVRTGDWAPMLARFSDDAEMEFVGVPAGPFQDATRSPRRTARSRPTTSLSSSRIAATARRATRGR